jgi:Carboxypeptidase regulatory-like domain
MIHDVKVPALCLLFSNVLFVVTPQCLCGEPTAQISGVVRDPQGTAFKGVTLILLSVQRTRKTETDENGKFDFPDLPLGTYELQVRQAGVVQVPARQISFSEPAVRQISIVLQLAASECFPKIQAAYEDRSDKMNLAGNIADFSSSARPVKNATLTATHKETGTTHVVNSNEKGEFQFDSLEPGKYTLKVSHQEYSELAGIDFWVTRENLTRLPTIYMFRKNEHSVILCQ